MPAEISIRPASTADVVFLEDMLYEALFVPPGMDPFPPDITKAPALAKYWAEFGSRDGDVGFVACDDGTAIGAAWVRRFDADDPGYGFVDADTPEVTVAVTPERRSNGVGTGLLESLLVAVPRCSLSVDDRSPAVALYERLGFEAVSRDEHSVTMLRRG